MLFKIFFIHLKKTILFSLNVKLLTHKNKDV